jgi:uncharacterized membrane protein YkoI
MKTRLLLAAAAIAAFSPAAPRAGAQSDSTLKAQRIAAKAQADSIKKAQRDSVKLLKEQQARVGKYKMTIPDSLATQATVVEFNAALTALSRAYAGGKIQSVELKEYNGKLAWNYEIKEPETAGLRVIVVDAKTGDVIGRTQITADELKLRAAEERAARKAARVKPSPKP